jgi:hypothetical protein
MPVSEAATARAVVVARLQKGPSYPRTFVAAVDGRLGVFRSRGGVLLRYLTDKPAGIGLPSLTPDRKRVFYVRQEKAGDCAETAVVPLSGGTSKVVRTGPQGGAQPIAAGAKGALAGNYCGLATVAISARAGDGKTYFIVGTRELGANGMAWAPDAKHLAVATINAGVRYLDVTTDGGLIVGKLAPCPARMTDCVTHAPSYAPDGTLYYVAANAANTRAKVVRLVRGKPRVLFTLPQISAHYSLAAAGAGQVLASGDADTDTMVRSDFVVRWDGSRIHKLRRIALQVDW